MKDLHTTALLAQEFSRLALYRLDRPDDRALAERVKQAEAKLREALN